LTKSSQLFVNATNLGFYFFFLGTEDGQQMGGQIGEIVLLGPGEVARVVDKSNESFLVFEFLRIRNSISLVLDYEKVCTAYLIEQKYAPRSVMFTAW